MAASVEDPDVVRVLHISDLHIEHESAQAAQLTADKLARAVHGFNNMPDLLVVTGDLTDKGTAPQFIGANTLITNLSAAVEVAPEHVFIVPGNHDIHKPSVDAREPPLGAPDRWEKLLASPEAAQAVLGPKLENYRAFMGGVRQMSWLKPEALTCYAEKVRIRGHDLFIVGLNSAFSSQGLGDEKEQDKLVLGSPQLVSPIRERKSRHAENALTLVVAHHPPQWICDCKTHASYISENWDVLLHGHLHEELIGRNLSSGTQPGVVQVGAGWLWPGHSNRDAGFQMLAFDFSQNRLVADLFLERSGEFRRLVHPNGEPDRASQLPDPVRHSSLGYFRESDNTLPQENPSVPQAELHQEIFEPVTKITRNIRNPSARRPVQVRDVFKRLMFLDGKGRREVVVSLLIKDGGSTEDEANAAIDKALETQLVFKNDEGVLEVA